jgi:hypothetical protein
MVFMNTFTTIPSQHTTLVLAHTFKAKREKITLNNQHESYRWFTIDERLNDKEVHQYTKEYFL